VYIFYKNLLEKRLLLTKYLIMSNKNKKNMKKGFLIFKRVFALLLCGFFALLTLDWVVGLVAFCIGSPYRGAFFPEVWGAVQHLFTWMPERTLTRFVIGVVVAILTFIVPIVISYLSFKWLDRLLARKKWKSF